MKKNPEKINPKMIIAFILSLFFIIFLILWAGFKKNPVPEKKAPEVPTAVKNTESSSQIFFASNGKNSVYKIKKGDKWSVIWNGQEGKEYDFVSNPVFSKDGSQLAYSAELNGEAYVVVNNTQEIYAYSRATNLIFSADGSTIAFVAAKSGSEFLVISSATLPTGSTAPMPVPTESQVYSQIGIISTADGSSAILLNEDGSHIAFTIIEDDKIYVVVDGVQSSSGYDSVSNLTLNDDGTYSYTATDGNSVITVENNVVTSTTTSSSNPTTSSSQDNSSSTSNDSSSSSSAETSYETYPYKISTEKDINLEGTRTDSACVGECNF